MKTPANLPADKPLNHIFFIMDGNGRWAKKRLLPRSAGHAAGVKRVKEIVDACFNLHHIPYVSLFCFSSENWNRPAAEIETLFTLLESFFRDNIDDFIAQNCRIRVVGDLTDKRIPSKIAQTIQEAMARTKDLTAYNFTVLFNYGGRQDIVQAAQRFARLCVDGRRQPADLDIDSFADLLWTAGLPQVDFLVRTSGELRISNSLIYQAAYAEMIFPTTYWPAFDKKSLQEVVTEYSGRHRRFGAIKE